jgi:hypothetical protein
MAGQTMDRGARGLATLKSKLETARRRSHSKSAALRCRGGRKAPGSWLLAANLRAASNSRDCELKFCLEVWHEEFDASGLQIKACRRLGVGVYRSIPDIAGQDTQ